MKSPSRAATAAPTFGDSEPVGIDAVDDAPDPAILRAAARAARRTAPAPPLRPAAAPSASGSGVVAPRPLVSRQVLEALLKV